MNTKNAASTWRRSATPKAAAVTLAAICAVLRPAVTCAHGVIGNRVFLSPIAGNDAFPDNALDLGIRGSDYQFSLMPELEKLLSDHSSLLFTYGWTRINPRDGRHSTSGSADLSIYFRQAVYRSVAHELELTLSPLVVLPIGNRQIADQGYTHLGGEILLGKGLGDLPDSHSVKYLRPLAVQFEAEYAGRIQGPANSDVVGNLELEYSLEYLDHFVQRLDVGPPLVQLVPYVQFNYAQSFIASRLTTSPDFRITPGLAYLGDYCELSVGAQIALNGAAPGGDQVALLGLIEIFYDEIFPVLSWHPL